MLLFYFYPTYRPICPRRLKLLSFVMTAMPEAGHFHVKGSVLGNSFEEELVLADLLQLQCVAASQAGRGGITVTAETHTRIHKHMLFF